MSQGLQIDQSIKLIAFYLPQFYPFPENDSWWGKGFTEWTNVTKAQPLFQGHYQPHLPADLGFYDLRVEETRREQASLAKSYGVSAFCYHYYWFAGKRLLEKPLDAMLADPVIDMPFCLSWANENWTRRWDAAEHEVLIAQDYTAHSDERFVDDLIPYMSDPRYLRVDGAAFFIIYRPQQIPDLCRRLDSWKDRFHFHGLTVHFCAALTHGNLDYTGFGFDSGVEFPPHNLGNLKIKTVERELAFHAPFHGATVEYEALAKAYLAQRYAGETVYKCVVPSWDNTARRKSNAALILDGNPVNFEMWLKQAYQYTSKTFSGDRKLLFINAWNEWAEGCHLEPDQRYGLQFLEALERVRKGQSNVTNFVRDKRLKPNSESHYTTFIKNAYGARHKPPRPVGWKVKRELGRIARQVTQGRLRVPMTEYHGELLVREKANVEPAGFPNISPAPDLSRFMNYEYEVDLTGDQAAAQVIRLVGSKKNVLEIGAGSGAITRHLVGANGCSVTALEINPASITKLRAFTDNIYDLDLNDAGWVTSLSASGPFDCIVAADVLEHLYDPWTVLRQMKSLLSDKGSIVLSLPHAGHRTVLGCLFQEDLDYREWGLLDKTHIRFFGIHNIQTLHDQAGLAIEDVRFVVKAPEQTEFADRWRQLPAHIRKALSENKFADVYQVVVRSVPTNSTNMPLKLADMMP